MTDGWIDLLARVQALESAASGPSQGTSIGVATVVDANTVDIAITSVWGITAADDAYYNSGGATAGEAAIQTVDPATGDYILVKPNGAVSV